MKEFERTIDQINDDIKPAQVDIKYLSKKLVMKLDWPKSFIRGI